MKFEIVVPWVLTLITALIGIGQFVSQQRQANRKPFLEKQLDLCFQAVDAAGKLATETDPAEWEESRLHFWRLYWGPLSIVEDEAVERAMVEFGKRIPATAVGSLALPIKDLEGPSYDLAHACRDLVLKSWRIDLPNVKGRRSEME